MELWLARDPDGSLWMYDTRPEFRPGIQAFCCEWGGGNSELESRWFPEVTTENSPKQLIIESLQQT